MLSASPSSWTSGIVELNRHTCGSSSPTSAAESAAARLVALSAGGFVARLSVGGRPDERLDATIR
jgi:hypothetical protein